MAGKLPSAFRLAALALAVVVEAVTSPVWVIFWKLPPLLFQAPQPVHLMVAGLLLLVKPQSETCEPPAVSLLSKAKQLDMTCAAETLSPPILKPLPLLPLPAVVIPWPKAQELLTVTMSVQAKKSNPSSALSHERQPLKTLPTPLPFLAPKPSAFEPSHCVSSLWCESQFRIVS